MIAENPHWTIERWEKEKENTSRCIQQTKDFLEKNKNIGSEKVDTSTVEGFNKAQEKIKKFSKIDEKKDYLIKLEKRIKDIEEKIQSLKEVK